MTAKKMFEKVEAYNEVAEIMGTTKAKVAFVDGFYRNDFTEYSEFRKYIKQEYIKEVQAPILKCEGFENDKQTTIEYIDAFGETITKILEVSIIAQ